MIPTDLHDQITDLQEKMKTLAQQNNRLGRTIIDQRRMLLVYREEEELRKAKIHKEKPK